MYPDFRECAAKYSGIAQPQAEISLLIQMTLATEAYSDAEIHAYLQPIHFPLMMPTEMS